MTMIPVEEEEAQSHKESMLARFGGKRGFRDYRASIDFPDGGWDDEDIQEMLRKLAPRQVSIGQAVVRGMTYAAASRKFHVNAATIYKWRNDEPWWEPLLTRERGRLFGDKEVFFGELIPTALTKLKAVLAGEDGGEAAYDAAKYVIDQRFGRPNQVKSKDDDDGEAGFAQNLLHVLEAADKYNQTLTDRRQRAIRDESMDADVVEVVEGAEGAE